MQSMLRPCTTSASAMSSRWSTATPKGTSATTIGTGGSGARASRIGASLHRRIVRQPAEKFENCRYAFRHDVGRRNLERIAIEQKRLQRGQLAECLRQRFDLVQSQVQRFQGGQISDLHRQLLELHAHQDQKL